MLFDFLVEIQEAKFGGKSCFVAIAAKHDTKDIEAGAKNFALEKDDDYGYVNAVVCLIVSLDGLSECEAKCSIAFLIVLSSPIPHVHASMG